MADFLRKLRENGPHSTLSLRRLIDSNPNSGIALSTLADALNGKSFPTWDTMHCIVSLLGGDDAQARLLWNTQSSRIRYEPVVVSLQRGISTWEHWSDTAMRRPIGAAAQAAKNARSEIIISRDIDHDLQVIFESQWPPVDDDYHLVLLHGKSGTGKSVALYRFSDWVRSTSPSTRVFVADDPLGFTDLDFEAKHVEPPGTPTILLLDDADSQDGLGLITRTARNGNVMIVAVVADTLLIEQLQLIFPEPNITVIRFNSSITDVERRELSLLSPGPHVLSKQERTELIRANIRRAVDIFFPNSQGSETAARLFAIYKQARGPDFLFLMSLATARGLPIPASAAAAALGSPVIPIEFEKWVLRSEYESDVLLWLTDRQAAQILQLRLSYELGREIFESRATELIQKLVDGLDLERPAHRRFLNRLLRSAPERALKSVLSTRLEMVVRAAQRDSVTTIAYHWLPVFAQAKERVELRRFTKDISIRAPRNAAEVAVFIYYLGANEVVDQLEDLMSGLDPWNPEPWIEFINLLTKALGSLRRQLARTIIAVLRCGVVDASAVAGRRQTFRILAELVESYGVHSERQWWWRLIETAIMDRSRPLGTRVLFGRSITHITERCIGQERNRLAMAILRSLSGLTERRSTWRELARTYEELAEQEDALQYATRAIDAILELLADVQHQPQRCDLYADSLRIAKHRDHSRLVELSEQATAEVRRWHQEGVNAHKLLSLHVISVRAFAQARATSAESAAWMLSWFQSKSRNAQSAQLFVATLYAIATSDLALSESAKVALSAIAQGRPSARADLASFCDAAQQITGLEHVHAPEDVFAINHERTHPVAGELILSLEVLDPSEAPSPNSLMRRFRAFGALRPILVTELLRVGAVAEARTVIGDGGDQPSPSHLLMLAAVEGCAGDYKAAVSAVSRAFRRYDASLDGAHPVWVRKAACAMLTCCPEPSKRHLQLVAQVMAREPLPVIDVALATERLIGFEPRLFPAHPRP